VYCSDQKLAYKLILARNNYIRIIRITKGRRCRHLFRRSYTTTNISGNSSIDTSLIRDIYCGPDVLFETCDAMKFVNCDDDRRCRCSYDELSSPQGATLRRRTSGRKESLMSKLFVAILDVV